MKLLIDIISERLHINKNTKVIDDRYYFNEYYSSVPKKTLDYIWDNYVVDWPMSKEAKEVTTASAFELLFTMACCLIDDVLGWEHYQNLGTEWYKLKLHGKNNPYDWSWFEEEIDENHDMLDECKNWIEKHYTEFHTIYNWCKKYQKDFNLEKIEGFYENVFDK